ncbi:MAG: hypothetical protein ABL931_22735, partial [Usitatibacteraceae bacterium]
MAIVQLLRVSPKNNGGISMKIGRREWGAVNALEVDLDAYRRANPLLIAVIINDVIAAFLEFLIFGVGQVARFKFQLGFLAPDSEALAGDKIELDTGLF